MNIELTPFEIYTIMKNTEIKNTKQFMQDLKNYEIKFHDILNVIDDYETYFNTEIDLRQGTNDKSIYLVSILEFKDIEEFKQLIDNYYACQLNDETYLIIE